MSEMDQMAALFNALQKQEEEKAKNEAEAQKDFNNPNFISMQVGKAYEMRLMYYASGVPGERVVPIIQKTVHAVKPENGAYREITCPSSDYLHGRNGYRMCPICTELSKLWDAKEKGSQSAKIAYDKYRRKFKGYAVVYVINDPTTPTNNGTFKILYVNAIMNNFLREKINGVDKKGIRIEGGRPIGFKAFDPSANGKNLLITATKDGDYTKYGCEFVDPEGKADLGLTKADLEKAFDALEFDKYYTPYSAEECEKFYQEVYLEKETSDVAQLLNETAAKTAKTETPAAPAEEAAAPVEEAKAETPAPSVDAEPEPAAEATTEAAAEPVAEVKKETAPAGGEFDINSILDSLPS